jgi:FkbM family methyltransferase
MTMDPFVSAMGFLGIYRTARLLRNRYLRPDLGDRSRRWRRFYSQFVRAGDLVFDIGANRGDRTEVFVEMGARVVAVEPLPSLATRLRRIYRYSQVNVEPVGIGRAPSTLPLRVCSTDAVSSFSEDFIESRSKENRGLRWDRVEMVPIVTADSLIEKHGLPAFLKIDVEGFESNVLAGLTRAVPSLSFEVHPENSVESAGACLEHLGKLSQYEFNLCLEERFTFELPQWVDSGHVLAAIREIAPAQWSYGDIYARRTDARSSQDPAALSNVRL